MIPTPKLTDRPALNAHRRRALQQPEPAFFLHEEAMIEVQERLELVNRTFKKHAIVTGFPQLWQNLFPDTTVVEDRDILNLEVGAYDMIVHAMALHWADDPIGQLVQCRRAVKDDGLVLALFFGGQTLHELRACLATAEAEITGGLSPRVLPMGDIRDLGGLLQRAGLALPVADSFVRHVEYRDMFHLMADLRAMGETNALASRLKQPTKRAVLIRAAEIYSERFSAKTSGKIIATFEVICLTGWSPHESQQQPLRPGSASARLADVLNATEHRLPTSE